MFKKVYYCFLIYLPNYDIIRGIYNLYWGDQEPSSFFAIPITNTLIQNDSKSIKDIMHMHTRNSYPPIIFGTEIESNLLIKNNAFYQMIVYHWSDGNKVA